MTQVLIRSRHRALLAILTLAVTGCGGQATWRGQPVGQATPAPTSTSAVTTPPETPGPPPPTAPASPSPTAAAGETPTPGAVASPDGSLQVVLARAVDAAGEPQQIGTSFPEDAEKIYLAVRSARSDRISLRATWIAVKVEGHDADAEVAKSRFSVGAGERATAWVEAPGGGFSIGEYRVDLEVESTPGPSLSFTVTPILPAATLINPTDPPRGLNVALAALGGKVESVTSEYGGSWLGAHLIDGTEDAWSAKNRTVPQEAVFSFYQGREAAISAVLINPATVETKDPRRLAKNVEVWVSTTSATDGFTRVGGARLHLRNEEQLIPLQPVRAKFVKIRFLSTFDGGLTQASEIRILEAREGPSILADLPKNLASPALGGAIVRFSSGRGPQYLTDGSVETQGWLSKGDFLPQDIVLAFAGDQVALVDRIVLNPKTGGSSTTWVKTFSVWVSTETPIDGFEEVGRFTLAPTAGDQAFRIGRRARFIRIRLLSNVGGGATGLGEIKVVEGSAPDYESILARGSPGLTGAGPAASPPPVDETGISTESEPNNDASQANALAFGRRLKGSIDPLGELDHYRLALPGPAPGVVTFEVLGRPYIRTSLSLLDGGGKVLKQFDPGRVAGREAAFSWLLRPGEYLARVTEPPVSIVLIWDTSGSMGAHNAEQLRVAVEGYLDKVQPSERLNLIRFSSDVEVLLPSFTSDRARLKAATSGKFSSSGGTALYDAIAKGMALLDGVGGNKAIVVMTDGQSGGSYPDFWNLVEEKRIRLYTIGLGDELQKFWPTIATSPARMMGYIAMATNGRFFFARTGEELAGLYEQIAAELRQISTYYLRPTLSRGTGTLAVNATGERLEAVAAPSQIELILDVSGSMKRPIEGRQRMDVAKDVMVQVIQGLPNDARVALRFYGHRIREGRPGDCQDTELVFPFARINKAAMIARVRALKALGTTPIAYTLRQVTKDFGSAPGEKLVILVTDGKEECGGSPSAVVSEMVAKGIKVRLNIVGFALAEAAVRQEMERVAKITGGKFYDAQNAKALRTAIQQSLAIPYEVRDAAGVRVAGGLTGEAPVRVPEGIYTVTVRAAGKPIVVPNVRVRYQGFTKVALRKEGQQIGVKVIGP